MKLYIRSDNGDLKNISFRDILCKAFKEGKVKFNHINLDEFSDGSSRWLELIKETEFEEISTTISFSKDYNYVNDFKIYVSPINRVVDEENSKRLI